MNNERAVLNIKEIKVSVSDSYSVFIANSRPSYVHPVAEQDHHTDDGDTKVFWNVAQHLLN
jgi:hypothetical protein